VVAVTTGLLSRLNDSEVEAVLAHELTHIKNRDMMVMTIATFLSSLAQMLVQWLPFMGGGDRDRDSGSNAALLLVVSLVVWIVSFILIRTLSRYREFAADRGAAIITGQPSHLISALTKISGSRVPTEDLRRVEGPVSALFITPALSGSSLSKLFSTHPTLEARIDALQRIEMELEA
jgi:heat shock protein HtpX